MKAKFRATTATLALGALWVLLMLFLAFLKDTGPVAAVVFIGFCVLIICTFSALWLTVVVTAIKERNSFAVLLIASSTVAIFVIAVMNWDDLAEGADPKLLTITPIALMLGITAWVSKCAGTLATKVVTWIK